MAMVNIKPGDLKGVISSARMLVANQEGKVKEIVRPPNGAKVGEQVRFAGVHPKPDAERT